MLASLLSSDSGINPINVFEEFNRIRWPDISGLGKIALYLNETMSMTGAESASRLGFMISNTYNNIVLIY